MRKIYTLLVLVTIVTASAVLSADTPPTQVTLNLTDDAVKFFKAAVWIGGGFVTILAILGVAFFGFDVRKAHASINESTSELKKLLSDAHSLHTEIKKTHEELIELKSKYEINANDRENSIEELGAKIEEIADKAAFVEPIESTAFSPDAQEIQEPSRDIPTLIRDVIKSSSFEWTTIQRIMKKTGLSREQILEIAQKIADVEISFGKKTKDHILKIKHNS